MDAVNSIFSLTLIPIPELGGRATFHSAWLSCCSYTPDRPLQKASDKIDQIFLFTSCHCLEHGEQMTGQPRLLDWECEQLFGRGGCEQLFGMGGV